MRSSPLYINGKFIIYVSNFTDHKNHLNILEIRDVIKSYENIGKIHLGGIPMIADDMMSFIKSDIIVFGIGVFLFII